MSKQSEHGNRKLERDALRNPKSAPRELRRLVFGRWRKRYAATRRVPTHKW